MQCKKIAQNGATSSLKRYTFVKLRHFVNNDKRPYCINSYLDFLINLDLD